MGVFQNSNGIGNNLQASRSFQRRGLPGINSDAYHFGYLDDQMANYRSNPPIHTKYDPLLETLYIFGALLFIVLIFTGFWFGCREYHFSLKRKNLLKSSGSDWTTDSPASLNDIPGRIDNDAMIQAYTNPAYPEMQHENVNEPNQQIRRSHDEIMPNGKAAMGHGISQDNLIHNTRDDRSDDGLKEADDIEKLFSPLEAVQNSLIYSLGSFEDLLSDQDFLRPPKVNKKIYSIRELYNLRPAEYNNESTINVSEEMDLEKAMELSFPCKHVSFQSPWTAEKTIIEIGEALRRERTLQIPITDNATRRITILRFVAIVANSNTLKNPNIFLPSLNRTAEALIDTGELFHLLDKTNVHNAKSLVEVMLQYCYAHWIINGQNDSFIRTHFAKWKINSPMVQPHDVLVRFLINLELGSYGAQSIQPDILKNLQNRILVLLRFFFNSDHCCDFLRFFPILAQAIEYTEVVSSQILYYELTYMMLKRHSECCMVDYLKETDSELKEIVQTGFWIKNDPEVRQWAEKIHMIVLNSNPKAMSWWKEIDGGRVFLANSPREIDLICNTADIQNAQRKAPGSWVP